MFRVSQGGMFGDGREVEYARNLALTKLGDTGLTMENLLTWQQGPDSFDILHTRALEFLSGQGINGREAVEEINQLSLMQIRALINLYVDGIRGLHLRAYRSDPTAFGLPHIYALSCLAKRGISGFDAVNEISELTIDQVRHVALGKNREEALKEIKGPQRTNTTWEWGQSIRPSIEICEQLAGKIPEPAIIRIAYESGETESDISSAFASGV